MKKILLLMVIGILTLSAAGCRQCRLFRGVWWRQEAEPVIVDPCGPMINAAPSTCSPCAPGPAATAAPTTTVVPGPGAYTPSNP
ncbi:MAG TPA: hypothetical protein PK777_12990 [Thermoguttaceae bacterium]|nr:hypothetical protein [Thermoguttaceae bacterium]HPP53861.1 hypothetical protein [Thermoguttaceae bacterium]